MDTFTTPVITSKAADDHYVDIQGQHQQIVNDISQHRERVAMYNQAQAIDQVQQKEKVDQLQKEQYERDTKDRELDLKHLALMPWIL